MLTIRDDDLEFFDVGAMEFLGWQWMGHLFLPRLLSATSVSEAGQANDANVAFLVTFEHTVSKRHHGSLAKGGTVSVKNNTLFDVADQSILTSRFDACSPMATTSMSTLHT